MGVFWKYLHDGTNLNGAHDSLVNAKAQMDVVLSPVFVPYLNRWQSIIPIDKIFTKTNIREWMKDQEPLRHVHKPWVEINEDNNIKWHPMNEDSYTGSVGGGIAGLSSTMQQATSSEDSRLSGSDLTFHGAC